MACCLMAPSHYLNESVRLCDIHLAKSNFVVRDQATTCTLYDEFEEYKFRITAISARVQWVNTLRQRQNGRRFADDTFKPIFLNENIRISIKISLKFVPKVPINNIPALVQIMAWRRPGDKPLSEPMAISLLTHICVTRPQWVKRHSACKGLRISSVILFGNSPHSKNPTYP